MARALISSFKKPLSVKRGRRRGAAHGWTIVSKRGTIYATGLWRNKFIRYWMHAMKADWQSWATYSRKSGVRVVRLRSSNDQA